jgi:hypothetical protein
MKKKHLTLISNNISTEQRIKNRIEGFRQDLFKQEGDVELCNELLEVLIDYLDQFEDDDIQSSLYKIKEAYFYIENFILLD